jgi:hypothetical protein
MCVMANKSGMTMRTCPYLLDKKCWAGKLRVVDSAFVSLMIGTRTILFYPPHLPDRLTVGVFISIYPLAELKAMPV